MRENFDKFVTHYRCTNWGVYGRMCLSQIREVDMSKSLDLRGKKFGRLIAIERSLTRNGDSYWKCKCSCGKFHEVRTDSLVRGLIKSCGCMRKDVTRERSITHGATKNKHPSKEYRSWQGAKARCYNPNEEKYPLYGGRGISMSDRWKDDFSAFLEDMGKCPARHTLDRIDSNGNYEPSNCRWALPHQQSRNLRANVWITHNGLTMIEADWARHLGIDKRTFNTKWKRGMSIEDIEKYAEGTKNARKL